MPETVHLKCLLAARAWAAAISESEAVEFLYHAAPADKAAKKELKELVLEYELASVASRLAGIYEVKA